MKYIFALSVISIGGLAQTVTPPSGGGGSGTVTSIATTSPITGGPITGTGAIACATCGVTGSPLSQFAATTSAQLAGVISDETGSSLLVFNTSPTLVTPTLGVATVTSINKVAVTAPATSATLTIADGKTLAASNTLTFTGTDSSSVAFGGGGAAAKVVASGSTALGTSAISSLACATVVTASATGLASTDTINFTPNASIKAVTGYAPASAGGLSIVAYPTTNTVNFDVCNWGTGTITPGAVTLNWLVTRSM